MLPRPIAANAATRRCVGENAVPSPSPMASEATLAVCTSRILALWRGMGELAKAQAVRMRRRRVAAAVSGGWSAGSGRIPFIGLRGGASESSGGDIRMGWDEVHAAKTTCRSNEADCTPPPVARQKCPSGNMLG